MVDHDHSSDEEFVRHMLRPSYCPSDEKNKTIDGGVLTMSSTDDVKNNNGAKIFLGQGTQFGAEYNSTGPRGTIFMSMGRGLPRVNDFAST